MITLEIPETKRKIYFPEDLEECNGQQYAEACMLIYRYRHENLSYEDFRVEMVYKLLNLKKGKRKLDEEQKEDMLSNIYMLSTFVDSFFEKDEEGRLIIKQYYIKNHSPVIKDAFKKWYGPADEFNDIDFGQYIDALNVYSHLEKQPESDLMYKLMAIFYRQKGQKYSAQLAEKNVKHLKFIYFGRVYGFFLLFASFQNYLFSATVFYQGQELDLSILFSEKEDDTKYKSPIPGIGMLSIANQLAESGVYGPIEKVRRTNFWEIMLGLYDVRKRDLDNRAQRKKEEAESKAKNKTK
jgi:hypothetical protein